VYVPRNPNETQFDRYRAWQWIKHLALADYVVPWAEKVGSTAREIFIVDLFAGAGTYKDAMTGQTTDGSPVIFARRAQRYQEAHPERSLQVICSERNQKNHAQLLERVRACPLCRLGLPGVPLFSVAARSPQKSAA
jgi:three-Cys-motif partner protein